MTAHFLVKGVAFHEDADNDEWTSVVPAKPISLRAEILNGGVSADGLTPLASVGGIKIRLGAGVGRVKAGVWYAPLLVSQILAEEADSADSSAGPSSAAGPWGAHRGSFASSRTRARAEMRQTAAAQRRRSEALVSRPPCK